MNRAIKLTITKYKTKNFQSATYSSIIMLFVRPLKFQTLFENQFQTKNKFQIFQYFTEPLWNQEKSKNITERNDKNNYLIGFLRGQFLYNKTKTREITLYILEIL